MLIKAYREESLVRDVFMPEELETSLSPEGPPELILGISSLIRLNSLINRLLMSADAHNLFAFSPESRLCDGSTFRLIAIGTA